MILSIQELSSNPWKKLAEDYRKEVIRLQDVLYNVGSFTFDSNKEEVASIEIFKFIDIERECLLQKERK